MPIETLNLCLYCWESNPRPRACQAGAPLRTNIPVKNCSYSEYPFIRWVGYIVGKSNTLPCSLKVLWSVVQFVYLTENKGYQNNYGTHNSVTSSKLPLV